MTTGDEGGHVTRRDFTAASVALGVAAGASSAGAATPVTESDVTITTPDGTCDAAFIHPAHGAHPGVLIWTDAFGLRPSMRAFGRRLAADGYSVLVPNPFYRIGKAPMFPDASVVDFSNPADRARLTPLMDSVNTAGAAEKDSGAYLGFLDAQPQVNTARKIGVQGYCMGGHLTFRTAATVAGRVGAAATFHGGGLVTDGADSPHLLIPKMQARLYVAIAGNDDAKQPDAKDKLKAGFAAAHVPAEVAVYAGTLHGWCVPDMPMQDGKPIYSKPEAERAWGKLVELYRTALA